MQDSFVAPAAIVIITALWAIAAIRRRLHRQEEWAAFVDAVESGDITLVSHVHNGNPQSNEVTMHGAYGASGRFSFSALQHGAKTRDFMVRLNEYGLTPLRYEAERVPVAHQYHPFAALYRQLKELPVLATRYHVIA